MDPILGQVILFAGNFAPTGWAYCNGQLLQISQNSALFSLLGTQYGGDGIRTFGLPDLNGRAPVGAAGAGAGLPKIEIGQKGGTPTVTLTQAQMPAHTHALSVTINAGGDTNLTNVATGRRLSSDARGGGVPPMMYTDSANATTLKADAVTATLGTAGSSQPVDNMSPYLGMLYIIATQGVYPSRP
jgi:microcystin-dependent protein